jgi:polysaccharide deacetylase 2 family uncharacterized protein YibQ
MARVDREDTRAGWRKLGVFWLSVLSLMAFCAAALEILGPPEEGNAAPTRHEAKVEPGTGGKLAAAIVVPLPVGIRLAVGRGTPGPVADPDPGMLDPTGPGSTEHLPRIAPDGRTPMQAYAAGFDPDSRRPRAALLLAGIGMNAAESDVAIRTLPGAVSLAVSPYAIDVTKLLTTARIAGHEYLIALPLEPSGYPLSDPGPQTLLTAAAWPENEKKLRWALSRIDGYAGATAVIGTMLGERLAQMPDQMDAVLSELSARGLFYVDPRAGAGPVPKAWGRHVDLVIDNPPDRDSIDAKLAALEQLAKDHGAALGLVTRPTPVAVARIAAWTNGLMDRGVALAPASALAMPPAAPVVTLTAERQH